MTHNLKVVGAGRLGIRVAILWKEKFPDARICFKTRSNQTERTAKWRALGFDVSSLEEEESGAVVPTKVPFVVFCAPPTGNPNYVDDIERSIALDTDESCEHGAFVFTASGGVYSENNGGVVSRVALMQKSDSQTMVFQSAPTHGMFLVQPT